MGPSMVRYPRPPLYDITKPLQWRWLLSLTAALSARWYTCVPVLSPEFPPISEAFSTVVFYHKTLPRTSPRDGYSISTGGMMTWHHYQMLMRLRFPRNGLRSLSVPVYISLIRELTGFLVILTSWRLPSRLMMFCRLQRVPVLHGRYIDVLLAQATNSSRSCSIRWSSGALSFTLSLVNSQCGPFIRLSHSVGDVDRKAHV